MLFLVLRISSLTKPSLSPDNKWIQISIFFITDSLSVITIPGKAG